MRDHAPEIDKAVLRARRDLYARMAQADNLEGARDMLVAEILETGGILNLTDAGQRAEETDPHRYMVQVCVHGLEVTAPTLLEAVGEWIDTAGHDMGRHAA